MKPLLIQIANAIPPECRHVTFAPDPVHITADVLRAIASTVASEAPETGGMLLGPAEVEGTDFFEFDESGSRGASSSVYRPDFIWANELQQFHSNAAPMRLFDGFVHSHPGNFFQPSRSAGGAEGDLGFANVALQQNEHLQRFLLFIVTGSGTDEPVLWPWVVYADSPDVAMLARVVVSTPDQFPARKFPQALASRIGALPESAATVQVLLDVDLLSQYAAVDIVLRGRVISCITEGVQVELQLPSDFPLRPPVAIAIAGGRHALPVFWSASSVMSLEWRLANLLRSAKYFAREV
ncbi:MAG: hypothetical protein ACOYOB_19535 [Myxococcota bacterium]